MGCPGLGDMLRERFLIDLELKTNCKQSEAVNRIF
jgi:hypothetical protein